MSKKYLPVFQNSSKVGVVTNIIFEDWLRNCFCPEVKSYCDKNKWEPRIHTPFNVMKTWNASITLSGVLLYVQIQKTIFTAKKRFCQIHSNEHKSILLSIRINNPLFLICYLFPSKFETLRGVCTASYIHTVTLSLQYFSQIMRNQRVKAIHAHKSH